MTADNPTKRSRRVVLTMMGTAAIGAVSMGFVPRYYCGPDGQLYVYGRWVGPCYVQYGGFGGGGYGYHGYGHGYGG
jgi:hypothetical protein